MSYWNLSEAEQKHLENIGVDYDLRACLECNPQGYDVTDIKNVHAVWQGENDGDDWRWVFRLKDKRYVFLQGGCDYTGWDCQSWATSQFAKTARQAAKFTLGDFALKENESPANAGLGHMLSVFSGTYGNNFLEVYQSLVEQIKNKKSQTWREQKDKEFGLS